MKTEINIESIITEYKSNIIEEQKYRWNNWKKDLGRKVVFDVVGGILSRQTSLTIQFANAPSIWNNEMAPVFLRSMAENHINLAWILKSPKERAQKFITYGIGELKKNLEHKKQQMLSDGIDIKNDLLIENEEKFISFQRYPFLTEVNLGSWSKSTIRKMAQEADCVDFYNYVYQPFSTCVHSSWGHISKHNVLPSDNPLHRDLFKPIIAEYDPDLHYLCLSAKYLAKSFDTFDKHFPIKYDKEPSYIKLCTDLEKIITTQ
jgi:hypothetical protein